MQSFAPSAPAFRLLSPSFQLIVKEEDSPVKANSVEFICVFCCIVAFFMLLFCYKSEKEEAIMKFTVQEMKDMKHDLGLSNQEIAQGAGLPVSTVQRIFSGTTKAPRKETLQAIERALHDALYGVSHLPPALRDRPDPPESAGLRETAPAYQSKMPGEYTVEDYYALPDDRRVELIDGVFYDMAAPTVLHQLILGDMYAQLRACTETHGEGCTAFLSPCDVQLDSDDRTMVQPDLFVTCREFDLRAHAFGGSPDLVVEIQSPSTQSMDTKLKMWKYCQGGVREYWVVCPWEKTVTVYDFTAPPGFKMQFYTFDDQIPVLISGGACSIDFTAIHKRIARYY